MPVLLFANKQDLPGALAQEEVADMFEVGQSTRIRVQPCSALTCEGLEVGLRWVVREAKCLARKLD